MMDIQILNKNDDKEKIELSQKKISKPKIQINTTVKDVDKSKIKAQIVDLICRYEPLLDNSVFEIFIRPSSLFLKSTTEYYTRIIVYMENENIDATAEHENVEASFKSAILKIEIELMKARALKRCVGEKEKYYDVNKDIKPKNSKENFINTKGRSSDGIPIG